LGWQIGWPRLVWQVMQGGTKIVKLKKQPKLKPRHGAPVKSKRTKLLSKQIGRPPVPDERRARPRALSARDDQWERWRVLASQRGMTISALVAYCMETTFPELAEG
jgi:hypothetical protein